MKRSFAVRKKNSFWCLCFLGSIEWIKQNKNDQLMMRVFISICKNILRGLSLKKSDVIKNGFDSNFDIKSTDSKISVQQTYELFIIILW